jgi:hypothetical protein
MEQMAAKMSAKKLQRLQKVRDHHPVCFGGSMLTRYSDKEDRRRSTDSRLLLLFWVYFDH